MKIAIEPLEDFRDDAPCFDWSEHQEPRNWRHNPPRRPQAREVAVAGLVGVTIFAFVFMCIVLAFVAL